MSIRIDQIKIKPESDCRESLIREAAKRLHISEKDITDLRILKKSIDARKKPDVFLLYQVAVDVSCDESRLLKNRRIKNIFPYKENRYQLKRVVNADQKNRPVIVGLGPAGLFAV